MASFVPPKEMFIWPGDCRKTLRVVSDNVIDSVVTDPPYELGFMGKKWDSTGVAYDVETWREVLRVVKPGGHMLAFGGTRTYHRMVVAIEDAGWEVRDCLMYLYGSGFPKGLNVAWEMHKRACSLCGVMVEYDHETEQLNERAENTPAGTPEGEEQNPQHSLRFVRATYLQTPVYACAECGQILQPFMPEQDSQGHRSAWEKSQIVWFEQPSLERRGDLETSQGQLSRCQACQMSHRLLADGAEGWIHNGASTSNGSIPWQTTNEDGSRPSYRPQSHEQLAKQSEALRLEQRAQTFRGWNVALKPAYEPIILARKPLEGTVAQNVQKYGTGALWIDGSRVNPGEPVPGGGNEQASPKRR